MVDSCKVIERRVSQGIFRTGEMKLDDGWIVGARKALLSLFLTLVLFGCGRQKAWTTEDSWYNPPPEEKARLSDWQRVDASRVYEVIEPKIAEAEVLLAEVPFVQLSEREAVAFAGKELGEAPGTRPYLVRGLYLNRITGKFIVYTKDGQLRVHHGSMGRQAVPMQRQPLVVQLEQTPAAVYVTVSMVE